MMAAQDYLPVTTREKLLSMTEQLCSPFDYDYKKAYELSDYWEHFDWGGKPIQK